MRLSKLLALSLLFSTTAFSAQTCLDTLEKYSETLLESRWKSYQQNNGLEKGKAERTSRDALDYVGGSHGISKERTADAQERKRVLEILWQSHDLNRPLDFHSMHGYQGHFNVLRIMSYGVETLYKDPTLAVGNYFFQHLKTNYKAHMGDVFATYFTDEHLAIIFPEGFFSNLRRCGASSLEKMNHMQIAAAMVEKAFEAKGYDFFRNATEEEGIKYRYRVEDKGRFVMSVTRFKEFLNGEKNSVTFGILQPKEIEKYLKEEEKFYHSLFTNDEFTKDLTFRMAQGNLKNYLTYLLNINAHREFNKGGHAVGRLQKNPASFFFHRHGEGSSSIQKLREALIELFDLKLMTVGEAIESLENRAYDHIELSEDWKKLLKLLEEKSPEEIVHSAIIYEICPWLEEESDDES